eukprot:131770_1
MLSMKQTHQDELYKRREEHTKMVTTTRPSKIAFGFIEIREYKRIMGDNPGCPDGCALSIDWEYSVLTDISITVDDYESLRPPRKIMKLTKQEREDILLACGFSEVELMKSERLLKKARNKRLKTIESLPFQKFEEVKEKFVKNLISLFSWTKGKSGRRLVTSPVEM